MKVYLQKLYSNARRKGLHKTIDRFGVVRNYAVRMMEGYHKMTGKTLTAFSLSNHIAKKKRNPMCKTAKMVYGLDAQSVQECIGRVYKGYQNFFRALKKKKGGGYVGYKRVRVPHVRKPWKNRSFTLLQCGYKFNEDMSKVRIQGKWYGIFKSQDIKGKVKRVTVKRDRCGDLYIAVLTDCTEAKELPMTGNAAGYDFGLKTFLMRHDGKRIESPEFLKSQMRRYRKLSRNLSRKVKGSNSLRKARLELSRFHRHIGRCREDWQWKTARSMLAEHDVVCLETLNLDGMKMLWGRKVSDFGFASFVSKLEYLASSSGKEVRHVPWDYASSQTCSDCGYRNSGTKDLRVRDWTCPMCGKHHDRDENAARNILSVGTSTGWRSSVRPISERGVA